ncbi:MAG TPA: TIGR00269 family protein [Candidatus Thermoplasmatota archaeon]|nr:TIGR00269 family protein [Candidatus Thermoplasmatota archaeon]
MVSCSKCASPSVVHIRYAGTQLCRDHFLRYFDERAKHEVAKQGRLPEGITAVALSGGKDSVSALHFMLRLIEGRPGVRLAAVTVDEGIAGYRDSALDICRRVTDEWDIPWHVVRTKDLAGYAIDEYAAGTAGPKGDGLPMAARPACSPCGVFRRAGMNRLAREIGATAVVTGHNLDDQAQTVLMNTLKGDLERAARLAPHTEEDVAHHPGLVRRILPFRSIPEKEVLLYAVLRGLPLHHEAECPYAARSHRFALRDVLVKLEEQTPGTRHALVKGAERLKPILQAALPTMAVASCPECREPTSGAMCVACTMKS